MQFLSTHNFFNNSYSNQDQFEALKQNHYKLDDHGLDVDYVVTSSSKDTFISIEQNSNGTLLIYDTVPNTIRELCIVDKNADQIKIDVCECEVEVEKD